MAGLVLLIQGCGQIAPINSISGIVLDEEQKPIPGAVVREKGTDHTTTTDSQGEFTLEGIFPDKTVMITAWASGYFNGGGDVEVHSGERELKITLIKHAEADCTDYEWVSAFLEPGVKGSQCEHCHARAVDSNDPKEVNFPFHEWSQDAHSRSTQNERFMSMYLGQDVKGNQSQPTRSGYSREYGRFPLRPDKSQAYFGPGYELDFPDTTGNCAACHAPAASINLPYQTDPTVLTGTGTEGVTCDFCHKVWDVHLDSSSGLPLANMPGVLSYEFRRPPEGHQFFAGPYDDVAPFEDTYSPIQRESQFCAPCHFGVFWDTQIYNSFGEWLASPYSDAETGKTCQDCHMPPGKVDHFARYSVGGMQRDPMTIFSHLMPGASDPTLLQNAVRLDVNAMLKENSVVVEVTVTNDQTGHHVPTDSPLRQMILLVEATDGDGNTLPLVAGEIIPEWGGVGDPLQGYYAGLPGKIFSKVLNELWTEVTPTGAYWNPTQILSDNRLAAFESDSTTYIFSKSGTGMDSVEVTILFRRAFKSLMDQKGWAVDDIVMEEETVYLVLP